VRIDPRCSAERWQCWRIRGAERACSGCADTGLPYDTRRRQREPGGNDRCERASGTPGPLRPGVEQVQSLARALRFLELPTEPIDFSIEIVE
jgi:hypothetical protein